MQQHLHRREVRVIPPGHGVDPPHESAVRGIVKGCRLAAIGFEALTQ
ncbi:MAG: hypothetical protein ACYDDT_04705 [Sulfuricella sp.]